MSDDIRERQILIYEVNVDNNLLTGFTMIADDKNDIKLKLEAENFNDNHYIISENGLSTTIRSQDMLLEYCKG